MSFNAGDTVQLKSAGEIMTIKEIDDKILASITPLNNEIDKLWIKEVNKRKQEIESNSVILVDGDKVFKKISQRLNS